MPQPLLAIFFGTPLAALATAAGAVSVPIIIHLLNRKRFRIVQWAAMRFLLAAEKKNARRLRVEQLILLAIRATAVFLLLLAMASVAGWAEKLWARYLPEVSGLAGPGGRRTHRILVFDGSLSMGLKRGDTNCFEKARALARQIVAQGERGDGFSVVLMAGTARRLVGGVAGPADDPEKVLHEIDRVRMPHGNGDLAGTLKAVADMVKQSPGKFVEKEVYFLTDMQKATWLLPQPGHVAADLQTIQGKARTYLVDVGAETPPANLAVTRLELAADVPVATAGRDVVFTCAVHNYAPETVQRARVSLWVGRPPRKAGDPPLEMREIEARDTRLLRGENTVSLACRFNAPGEFVVQVRLENDALDIDDTRGAVLSVRDQVPVLLVNGKPAPDLYDQATEYLYDALNPYQNTRAPGTAPVRPRKLTASEFSDAGLGDLTGYDCVFLCGVERPGLAEVRRLEQHVLRGGGVVICLGPNVDIDAYNELLYEGGRNKDGTGLLPARLTGIQTAPKGYHFHFHADAESFREPPLAAFKLDRDRARLLSAPFYRYVKSDIPSSAVTAAPRRVLSFLAAPDKAGEPKPTDPALYAREPAVIEWRPPLPGDRDADDKRADPVPANRGRVVLLTSTVNTDWTDWPRQGNFVWFMQEVLAHAAAGRLRERSATVGQTLEEYLSGSGAVEKALTIHMPDGRREETETVVRQTSTLIRWADTDISGLYRATVGDSPEEHVFAVNVPPATESMQAAESDLTRADAEEMQKTYPEWEFQVIRDLSEAKRDFGPVSAETESGGGSPASLRGGVIARIALLLALALLVAEVILAWHFGHYSSVHERDRAEDGWPRGRAGLAIRAGMVTAGVLLALFVIVAAVTLTHAAITGDFLGFLPEQMRAGVERSMGIPPPAPGEGSRWNLEFQPYLYDAATDPWLVSLLGIALIGLVIAVYRKEGRTFGAQVTPGRRAGRLAMLTALRVGLFLALLTILLPQLRLWFERQSWPDVVILIDDSASMAEADAYRDPRVREMAARLASTAELNKQERLKLAQALLTRGEKDWVTRLLTERQVKVHIYHCSSRAARLAAVTKPADVPAAVEAIQGLEAKESHDSSQLGAAVRQVLNDFRGSSLAAVVMLTDGVTTEGEDLRQVSKYAARMKVPLFFVGIGDSHESRDIILSDLEVAETVLVNDNLIFRVNLTVKGYGDQLGAVKVTLKEKDGDKVKELSSQVVSVDGSGKPVKVRLEHRPDKPGPKTYIVEAEGRADEVDKENNTLKRDVFVQEAKLIKVLYVEGYSRWEYRYVKTLLERESDRLKNNKTMELNVVLIDSDPEYAKQDKSALKDFPTRAELFGYDVVILGDVDPNPRGNAKMAQHLKDIADFVLERGGGLLMIAGERYAPYLYKNSPLSNVLPIDVTAEQPPAEPEDGWVDSYRPELTPVGRMHPIFSFNERDNEAVWNKLREMYWHAEGYKPKPAAEVLATHPTKKGSGARGQGSGSKEGKHPLVVQHFVGAGKAMFFGFHETWRWRWREDELRFNQFWIQTVRYLARGKQARVDLRLDRQTPYLRGEAIKMTVRFPDDAPPPAANTDVRVVVLNKDIQERRTVKLDRLDGSRGTFEGTLTRTPEGRYEFWLAQPRVPDPQPRAECKVLAPPGEKERIRMNQQEMEEAARESRGRFYTLADAGQLLDDLPSGSRVTLNAPGPPWLLWNHALMLLAVLLFLSAEWILRKKYHLL